VGAHLLAGAAEVEVDDVGTGFLDAGCRLGHGLGVPAVDLDGDGVLVGVETRHHLGAGHAAAQGLAGDELGDGEADGADAPHEPAEAEVGDPLHRREHEVRLDADVADLEVKREHGAKVPPRRAIVKGSLAPAGAIAAAP
jgi:hypothetical protein